MNAEYITHYGTDLSAVNAARVSMDKESEWESEGTLSEKDAKLISYLAAHGHSSCFEHQGATLRLKVPLFVRSQIHRHRTFSYNEISRRYVKDNLEFYWPDKWRKAAAK
jgi:thymidylate synthase (FAD)